MSSRTAQTTRRILSLLAAAAMVATVAVAASAPAQAGSQSETYNCPGTGQTSSSVTLAVGETLTITTAPQCDGAVWVSGVGSLTYGATGTENAITVGPANAVTLAANDKVVYTATTVGTAMFIVYRNGFGATTDRTYNVTVVGGSSSSASASSPPPSVLQQFGKPASGTCDAAAPVTLNWGGAGSGGWGESWAHWMNSGNGGAVCTRTLVYSNSLGAWTIG